LKFRSTLSRSDKALASSVGLFLFAVYLLTYRGGFHSIDEVSMFAVTESLVKFGRFDTDQIAWTQWTTSPSEAQGFFGTDGHVYSKKGLALSLAQAPLYWLGLVVPGLGMLQAVSLLNVLLTALTGSILFLYARQLGFEAVVALAGALLFGLSTIAWVYSKYLFSEPLAALLLLLTVFWLYLYRQRGRERYLVGAGLAAGLAVLTRANNLLLVPVFGLYLLVLLARPPAELQVALFLPPEPSWFYLRLTWRRALRPVLVFGMALALAGVLLAWYNLVRLGNAAQTGYDLTLFSGNVFLGLYKLLFSPLRGLFVYSPVLLLAIPGWWFLRRRQPAEAWLLGGLVAVTLGLFASWSSGEGLSWGSRFLVSLVPLGVVLTLPVIARASQAHGSWSRPAWVSLAGLVTVSTLIQVLGVTINPWVFLARLQSDFGGEFFLERTAALYDFRYTQIVGQLQNWSVSNSDLAWWQPGRLEGGGLLACLALLTAAGANLVNEARRRRPAPATGPGSDRSNSARRNRLPGPLRSHLWLYALALAVALFTLWRYNQTDRQFGPRPDPYSRALAMIEAQAGPGDWIVSVAEHHYHVPMNRFKAKRPIIGFARSVAPFQPSAFPLLEVTQQGRNVWLVTQGFGLADPTNRAEAWLAEHAYKAGDVWLEDDFRLVRYATSQTGVRREMSAEFDGSIQLVAIRVAKELQVGQLLPVAMTWRSLRRVDQDLFVFLQLLAGDGSLVGQFDGPPLAGFRPTSGWTAGETVEDKRALVVPTDLLPGEYRLIAGLYNPVAGSRLSLAGGEDFVDLGLVQVGAKRN
jgi:hypothetical protein